MGEFGQVYFWIYNLEINFEVIFRNASRRYFPIYQDMSIDIFPEFY